MKSQCIFGLSFILAGSPAFAENSTNLTLHRSYDYWPMPEYHDSHDPENDPIYLTDGVTKYTGGMWMNKTTVGWAAGVDVPVVIQFDLGDEATLDELVFNTCGGGGAGVVEVGIRVYVSLDNENYILAAEHVAPPAEAAGNERIGVQIRLPLKETRARYVALASKAPPPHYFVFVDEIEIHGRIPADPASALPVLAAVPATGAKGLYGVLSGGTRAFNLLTDMTAPIGRHINVWPTEQAEAQRQDVEAVLQRAVREADKLPELRAGLIERQRERARQVYGRDSVVWETVPDDRFTMLSLPVSLKPTQRATVHTVVNAMEATALGVANLSSSEQPIRIEIQGAGTKSPTVTPRVARFFVTTNAQIHPDALLRTDFTHVIPSGESRLVWLEVESEGAEPGLHAYDLSVHVGDTTHAIPLSVHVHDVTLSRDTPLATGNWSDLNNGEFEMAIPVREEMLANRMTIGAGGGVWPQPKKDENGNVIRPVELDTSDLDKFIKFHKDFPQLSIFVAFHQYAEPPTFDWFGPVTWMDDEFKGIFREWIGGIIDRFIAGGRDYDEFMIMIFDETLSPMVAQTCELVHSVDPNVRMKMTIPQATKESVAHMVEAGMNVFNHHGVRLGYDNAPDGYPILSSGGRELHVYGAADAAFGSGKERDPLGFFRYLHWTAFLHGATGVHFWNMLHNNGSSPIWEDEGIGQVYWPMVYPIGPPRYQNPPPDVQTAERVVPSRRWRYVRMGIEDYMLLKMARERIEELGENGTAHQQALDGIIKTVAVNRDSDRELFRRKRRELVELVEMLGRDL